MNADKQRGPEEMTAAELDQFLGGRPTGALCFTDEDGRLTAIPACVMRAGDGALDVDVPTVGDISLAADGPACLVADTFTAYRAIRGVIVQGKVFPTIVQPTAKTRITLVSSLIRGFSFANARE